MNILTLMFLVKGSKKHNSGDMYAKRCLETSSRALRRGEEGKRGERMREETQQLTPSHRPAGQRRHTNRFARTELGGRSQSSLGFI